MAVLQVRIDDELKNQATAIYSELGMDLSTAVRMFFKKSVLVGGIPFDTKINESTLKAILAIDRMRTISEDNGNSEMTLDEMRKCMAEDKVKLLTIHTSKGLESPNVLMWGNFPIMEKPYLRNNDEITKS